MKSDPKTVYSSAQIAAQVARMGRAISRDYAGKTLHVVAILEDAFVFAADLMRHISCPVVCHFVRTEAHVVSVGGYPRKEIFFSHQPDLHDREVLLVDAVLDTGVTLDFLARRLLESRPRSLRVAVLLDRPHARHVELTPDYRGFEAAPSYLVGYGLSDVRGIYRNLPYVGSLDGARSRKAGQPARAIKSRHKSGRRRARVG